MSDKATFTWTDPLDLVVQLTKDKRQVNHSRCVSKNLHMDQAVKSVLHMCGNFKLTVHSGGEAQKCV